MNDLMYRIDDVVTRINDIVDDLESLLSVHFSGLVEDTDRLEGDMLPGEFQAVREALAPLRAATESAKLAVQGAILAVKTLYEASTPLRWEFQKGGWD